MKITFCGHKRMTLGNQPYEPVQVQSIFIVEKEVPDEFQLSSLNTFQEKVNKILDDDLEKKISEALKLQQKTRNKMKLILKDL